MCLYLYTLYLPIHLYLCTCTCCHTPVPVYLRLCLGCCLCIGTSFDVCVYVFMCLLRLQSRIYSTRSTLVWFKIKAMRPSGHHTRSLRHEYKKGARTCTVDKYCPHSKTIASQYQHHRPCGPAELSHENNVDKKDTHTRRLRWE
jgi:hypothetical protein